MSSPKKKLPRSRLASRGIFSAYFSSDEEAALHAYAAANGTSVNYIIRLAVRRLVGLPGPKLHRPQSD